MKNQAKGIFEVSVIPAAEGRVIEGFGRMTIDKIFRGDLEGKSIGEMISAGDPSKAKAGYVALERVEGALDGKAGSFFLQHRGVMDGEKQELLVTIVPGSGTGALSGISGSMQIAIDTKGVHSYVLEYSLPE